MKTSLSVLLFLLASLHCSYAGDLKTDVDALFAMDDVDSASEDMDHLVVEQGEALIPLLETRLQEADEDRRGLALYGISMIGGTAARDILKKEYERAIDVEEKAGLKGILCFVLASTKTEQDIDFLIDSLHGPTLTVEGQVVGQAKETAALALGVLRVRRAIPSLDACSKFDKTISSGACRMAAGWIAGPQITTPQADSASETDQIILKVFRSGIPRIGESESYYDADGKRMWNHKGDQWIFEPVAKPPADLDAPSIRFDLIVSQDKQRAIVRVGLNFGVLNGSGYAYLLKKGSEGWEITGLLPTWIS